MNRKPAMLKPFLQYGTSPPVQYGTSQSVQDGLLPVHPLVLDVPATLRASTLISMSPRTEETSVDRCPPTANPRSSMPPWRGVVGSSNAPTTPTTAAESRYRRQSPTTQLRPPCRRGSNLMGSNGKESPGNKTGEWIRARRWGA